MEKEMKIIESLLLHSESTLLDDEAMALEHLLKEYKREHTENIRLKFQDIPYLEGTIKGYKDRVEELKQELKKFYEGEIFTAKQ